MSMRKARLRALWTDHYHHPRSAALRAVNGVPLRTALPNSGIGKIRRLEIERAVLKLQLTCMTSDFRNTRPKCACTQIAMNIAELIVRIDSIEREISECRD